MYLYSTCLVQYVPGRGLAASPVLPGTGTSRGVRVGMSTGFQVENERWSSTKSTSFQVENTRWSSTKSTSFQVENARWSSTKSTGFQVENVTNTGQWSGKTDLPGDYSRYEYCTWYCTSIMDARQTEMDGNITDDGRTNQSIWCHQLYRMLSTGACSGAEI
jgi:hypothetical protein